MTAEKFFTIKDYPNDVYAAVGRIIRLSQEWEEEYKKLARLLRVRVKKVEKSSLNKLNEALKKEKLLMQILQSLITKAKIRFFK